MKIKASDLEGVQLAEWAAKAQGWVIHNQGILWWQESEDSDHFIWSVKEYRPDINGGQAMELQKKFRISVLDGAIADKDGLWVAGNPMKRNGKHVFGETPKIAICLAAVTSVFGEYVDIND